MAIEVKVLQSGEETILMGVAAAIFDNPVDAELTKEFLDDPRLHIAFVIDDGLVVGFASGVHYIHLDKPPELWINEVAIAPTHRHRGLGKAALGTLLDVGRSQSCTDACALTMEMPPPWRFIDRLVELKAPTTQRLPRLCWDIRSHLLGDRRTVPTL